MKVGLISDTHGLLRPEALAAMRGCERIVHAGDIGNREVLQALQALAPVTVVAGNNDRAPWAEGIPLTATLEVAGARIFVLHDLHELDLDPAREGFAAVVSGHSHQPLVREEAGVLFVNPGSAGPRRFRLPVSVGYLHVAPGARVRAELAELSSGGKA
ncbi:MAG TPA: metallophosphoesterase family protein [Usitatibacter sp.]|nr:metallophosphoesterase family protein [Usitatibacter sp.]